MEAADIIAATPEPPNKEAVLASLGSLLETIDLEQNELREHRERKADFESQLASLSSQRDQVKQFADAHARNEPISHVLVDTFEHLIDDDDISVDVRNQRMIGLFRSASACIMAADWPASSPLTVEWVESFNRVTERKVRDLRANSQGYAKVAKIHYVTQLTIDESIYNQPRYDRAPKEYWLQYAGFSLIAGVLNTRKRSQQLRDEMGPALTLLNVALGRQRIPVVRPPGL